MAARKMRRSDASDGEEVKVWGSDVVPGKPIVIGYCDSNDGRRINFLYLSVGSAEIIERQLKQILDSLRV